MKTLIALATYNELKNLPRLVDQVRAELERADLSADVLVIDDNSPDGTGRWCDERAAADPQFDVIHRPGKLGLGTATVLALKTAVQRNYDAVLTMDADLSHDPRYLPALIAGVDEADVVIGSRYVPGGGVDGWPWRRRVMSRLINGFARMWLGIKPRDTSGAFRCYRCEVLRRIDLSTIQSQGYSVFEELLAVLTRVGAKFREHPIVFVDREEGQSKITLAEAVRSVVQLIRLRFG